MTWLKARWEGVMFQQNFSYFEKVCSIQKRLFGGSYKILACIHEPEAYWFCYNEELSSKFGKILIRKFLKEGFNSFEKGYLEVIKQIEKLFNDLNKRLSNLDKINDKELVDIYLSALELTSKFASYTLTCEPAELYLNQLLREKLVKELKQFNGNVDNYFTILTSPSELSFIQQEKNELIKIAEKKKQNKNINSFFIKHAEKWWFINNSYAKQFRLGKDYFIRKVNEIIKKNEKKVEINTKEKKQIFDKIKDRELKMIVKIIEKYIYLHDIRKLELLKWIYYINEIIKEFAKRLGMEFKDICFMTHYEMTDALIKKGKISDRVLQARKKGVSTYDENGGHVFLGLKASEWKSKIFRKIKKDVKELIGMAASPGTIKGIVKVLISTLQANKLKKGEILVTSHTTPDWVKIMKRATAIITERGGITCHAAIISRELGVPCVTGIANATEILKDGGLVEVNGTKGIVKRVKR